MPSRGEYTVGWICAIRKEYVAARAFLDETYQEIFELSTQDNNTYTFGKLGAHLVVIAVLPDGIYGISFATSVAIDMLHSFPNIKIGLLVGIGGGAPSQRHDIRLGDVVVSTPGNTAGGVIQYDLGKTIQNESFVYTGFLNQPPTCLLTAVTVLQAKYDTEGHQLDEYISNVLKKNKRLQKEYQRPHSSTDKLYKSEVVHCQSDTAGSARSMFTVLAMKCNDGNSNLVMRPERSGTDDSIMIHHGLIASANQLMKDALIRDKLAAEKGVLCFEMEAAGLMNHFPCLVIRGICDYSDTHKNDQWQGYAAMAAAAYTKDLLCCLSPCRVAAYRDAKGNEEDKSIREWLAGIDYSKDQKYYLDKWQKGTGGWLIKSEEFGKWLEKDNQILFCPGIPGAGKTFAASFIIDHLCQKYQRDADMNIGIAYVYFDWRKPPLSRSDLLSSLLSQLIRPSIPEIVRRFYNQHITRTTRPSSDDIMDILVEVVGMHTRTFIIVDALDECNGSVGSRSDVLATLFNLQDKIRANLFVTSRHIHAIETEFDERGSIVLEIRARDEDIRRYLDGHIAWLPKFVLEKPGLAEKIILAIIKAADGMFLLAYLHLQSLKDTITISEIKRTLEMLPKVSGAYDAAYDSVMHRIEQQPMNRRILAAQILSWIFRARRPLGIIELQHALAVTENSSSIDLDNIPAIDIIVDVCAGLVTTDKSRGTIRLVHFTAQEYIDQSWIVRFPDADVNIAKTCLAYLSYETFERGPTTTWEEYRQRLKDNPLYEYVARYWGFYARESYLEVKQLTSYFLRHSSVLASAAQVILEEGSLFRPLRKLEGIIGLHIAAYFGINHEVIDFLKDTSGTAMVDSFGHTALHWAVMGGQLQTVEVLLQGGLDVNVTDTEMRSALHYAASQGDAVLTHLLLSKGALTEIRDIDGQTPLLAAADKLSIAAIKELLNAGAFVNAIDTMSRNALHLVVLAAKDQSAHLAHLLLSWDIDASLADFDNMTPLHYAVATGNRQVADTLLQAGVDINIGVERSLCTIRMEAGQRTYQKRQPPQTAEANITNAVGLTPLHFAACSGHCAMTEYLLGKGANPNSQSHDGDTPLHIALNRGILGSSPRRLANDDAWTDNRWQVELSADYISDYEGEEAREIYGYIDEQRSAVISILLSRTLESPLHKIRYDTIDSEVAVQSLLEKGANAFARNWKGQTALHFACSAGSSANVCKFLDWGCSITNKDSEGLTALHYAVQKDKNREGGRQLCLKTDRQGRSLLHHHLQSCFCSLEMVTILLDHGVRVDDIDKNGDTPLSMYLRSFHLLCRSEICLSLLQQGASALWTSPKGENLAHLSMHNWDVEVELLKILSEHDVDLSAKDKNILEFILQKNLITLNDRDEKGMTPLMYALEESKKTRHPNLFAPDRWKRTWENLSNLAGAKGFKP
ncbi:ankyrin repeat-containing domain protein [Aspergillus pseudotamarii]|uniref:Ankyrin repeat-containing domain protein n=1 Tax=Aspergillus pseudotamarii TaxID=132259 RepID=A0A5N6T636_ASPPS|nr:ankyrin repeat-containing domain protein [Aspergillus pseudotamarii]KAE8141784.1 ankyrin repeat-containing domain protein [Aspergillus pseudotamarii]